MRRPSTPALSGSTLTLGALALLAGASYWRPRYGARNYSELQQRLLRIKNQYSHSPETAIRAIDMVLSMLPGMATKMTDGYPGVFWTKNALELLFQTDPETEQIINPDAGLPEYLEAVIDVIRKDNLAVYTGTTTKLVAQLDPQGREIVWPYISHIPWLSKQVADWVRAKDRGQISEETLLVNLRRLRSRASHILDWALGTNAALGNFTFEQAEQAANLWHTQNQELSARVTNQRKRASGEWFDSGDHDGQASQRGQVMHTFPNGWTVQRLTTPKQLLEEGNMGAGGGMLRHCIGTPSQPYVGQVRQGVMWADSLRTPENRPWLTATIYTGSNDVHQVKGFKNRLAGTGGPHGSEDDETRAILLRRAKPDGYTDLEAILDDESAMMDAYFRKMGYHWNADSSGATPRLRRMAEEKAKRQRRAREQAAPQGARPQGQARGQAQAQEQGGFNRRPSLKKRR